MSGINKVIIVGRLGSDPESKTISSGDMVCRLSLATSESWMDKNSGQKKEKTEWHRIVVWGKLAEICDKYLSKGRQIFVEGKLQTRSWEDQQGIKKYTTEIVASNIQFLGGAGDKPAPGPDSPSKSGFDDFGPEPSFDSHEEIPF